ncbi:tape measure protein [Lactobacillus helveticus]|uniref:tape measure protein n=1 Tax=Lactobacillus helveticus TaxID=1587 RepID=UPI00069AFDAD|nr:tape measure protein [Lactobacillus helveticus]
MAGTHEGYSLGIRANYAQVEEAKKATTALYAALGEVERRAKNLHMNATLPKEINHIDTVTASYIRRLESEGKTYKANQQKAKAYQGAISELSNKQNELRRALDKAKNATDRNSNAYRTQLIRFNETVAEINRYKAGLRSVNEEMRKSNPNYWDKVKSHLHATNTEAKNTHSLFKTIFSANLVSHAVIGGFNLVRNNIGGMIRSAHEYNVEQQKMNATWLTLTGNAHKGKAMVNQINNMAAAAQNDTKMVDALSQKFYAINKSPQQTAKITKSVLTLQDAFGATDAAVENFGTQFSQMMANQKVSGQDMLSFINVFPEYREQLLKTVNEQQHTKLSMKQLNAEISNGKISSKVAIDALEDMAHHYKNATGNFTKTIPGMVRTIKSQMPRLMSAFDRPFTKAENPVLKQVSDWSTSSKTRSAFNHLGSVVSHGMNRVMSTVFNSGGRGQKTVGQLLNSGIYKAAGAFKKLFNYLAIHGKDIRSIGKSVLSIVSTIGKGVWKDFSAIAINIGKAFGLIGKNADKNGGTLHALAEGLNNLSKNKLALKAISGYIVLIASAKGVKNATSPLINLGIKGVRTFQVVRGISRGLRGIADAQKLQKMGELETHFYNIGKGARDAAKAIGAFSNKIGIPSLFGGKASAKAGPQAVLDATVKGNRKWFTAPLESIKHAGGFKNLTTAGKLANGVAGVGVAVDSGMQFFNAFKNRHNADKRSQYIGQGIGSAIGGGIGMYFGGPLGAMVGSQLGKVAGKWGGIAVNSFTKGWQKHKPPKNFWSLEHLGWSIKDTISKATKFGGKVGEKFGTSISKGKDFVKKNGKELALTAVSPVLGIPALLYKNNPKFRKSANSVFNHVKAGWDGAKAWASKLGHDTSRNIKNGWNGMQSWASNRLKDVQYGWKGAPSWFSHLGSSMVKNLKGAFSGIGSWFSNLWHKATDWINKIRGQNKSELSKLSPKISARVMERIDAHANGGKITNSHTALVGEVGPELAYKPYANHARLLGANGPEFAKVHTGEHILNAHDTLKVLSGGLGHGMILKGYADGTEKLGKTKKTVTDDYKQIVEKSSKSLNKLSEKSKNAWSKITHSTDDEANKTQKNAISHYSKMRTGVHKQMDEMLNGVHKQMDTMRNNAHKQMDKMRIGIHKQMDAMHHGVVDLAKTTSKGFGKELGHMKSYAHDAIVGTINQVNKGISGIDKVLGQFGGNKSVIKPVKFATGTDSNGRLTRNTYAMVNDATTGPRQEALISDKNEIFMPRGHNVKIIIPKGWGILNGTQTLQAGLQRFAKGTGLSHSALIKLAEKAGADPDQSFKDMFLSHIKSGETDFERGSTNLARNSSKHFGNPWSAAMWTVINNAIGNRIKTAVDSRLIKLAKQELGSSALKWIKNNLGNSLGAYGSLANPSGYGVARWRKVIERAASAMHVSLSKADLAHILNVTAHESGGNPRAVNLWDSNAKAGTPSKGVLQFIQPTFDHYAVKGHHNILSGYDQYLAMFNDTTWRRDLTLGGWGPTGPVRGYAKGGKSMAYTPFIAGERGPELITADGPVKVDTHEHTKRKLSDLVNLVEPKINRPTHRKNSAPIININFNGPIGGTIEDAKRIAEIVKREITQYLVNIGDEFGTDPSLY